MCKQSIYRWHGVTVATILVLALALALLVGCASETGSSSSGQSSVTTSTRPATEASSPSAEAPPTASTVASSQRPESPPTVSPTTPTERQVSGPTASPGITPTPEPPLAMKNTTPVAPQAAIVPTTSVPVAAPTNNEGAAATGETGPGGPVLIPNAASPIPTPSATPTAQAAETAGAPKASGPRARVIALDPGHGGPEPGASAQGLAEKDINLKIALKLADLLRAQGYRAVLTRDTDRSTSPDYKGGGYPGGLVGDLQARVDIANAAQADVFISIHNNGSGDPNQSGTEVWYNQQRSFADRNLTLARLAQEGLLKRIRALGYQVFDRGIKDDANFRVFQGRVFNLFVLGPGEGARPHAPTRMPGILGESLFISHAGDASMLRQERTLDAIAAGYRDAVMAYFEKYPE